MKNYYFISIVSISLFLGACNLNSNKTTTAPVPENNKPIVTLSQLSQKIDPVCEMELTDDGIADTAFVDGKTYGFCNVGCKQEFLQNKAKYLK